MDLSTMPALPPELQRALGGPDRERSCRFDGIEWRDAGQTGDGSYTLSGVAAVYDTTTVLYRGTFWTLEESIAPGAFTDVLAAGPEVHLNHGHNMESILARLTSVGPSGAVPVGGLKLWESERGLEVFSRLDSRKANVKELAIDMEERQLPDGGTFRMIDQMSFKFRVAREELTTTVDRDTGHETDHWRILEIGDLFDVCVCAQGAYPTTTASLRSVLAGLRHSGIDPEGIRPRHASAGTATEDAITPPAGGESARARRLAAMRARARVATLTLRRS